jgi:hypothetical protein
LRVDRVEELINTKAWYAKRVSPGWMQKKRI